MIWKARIVSLYSWNCFFLVDFEWFWNIQIGTCIATIMELTCTHEGVFKSVRYYQNQSQSCSRCSGAAGPPLINFRGLKRPRNVHCETFQSWWENKKKPAKKHRKKIQGKQKLARVMWPRCSAEGNSSNIDGSSSATNSVVSFAPCCCRHAIKERWAEEGIFSSKKKKGNKRKVRPFNNLTGKKGSVVIIWPTWSKNVFFRPDFHHVATFRGPDNAQVNWLSIILVKVGWRKVR